MEGGGGDGEVPPSLSVFMYNIGVCNTIAATILVLFYKEGGSIAYMHVFSSNSPIWLILDIIGGL